MHARTLESPVEYVNKLGQLLEQGCALVADLRQHVCTDSLHLNSTLETLKCVCLPDTCGTRLRGDCNKMFADTNDSGYVWYKTLFAYTAQLSVQRLGIKKNTVGSTQYIDQALCKHN